MTSRLAWPVRPGDILRWGKPPTPYIYYLVVSASKPASKDVRFADGDGDHAQNCMLVSLRGVSSNGCIYRKTHGTYGHVVTLHRYGE